jgi:hypothetical protein
VNARRADQADPEPRVRSQALERFAVDDFFFGVPGLAFAGDFFDAALFVDFVLDAFGGSSSAQSSERAAHSLTFPRRRCQASGRIT